MSITARSGLGSGLQQIAFRGSQGRDPGFRCICKVKSSPWKSGHQSFVVFTESQSQLQDEARFDRQPERETWGLT